MRPKTYSLRLTEDEMVALYSTCTCCVSDYDSHSSASGRLHEKLSQIGYFRRRAEATARAEAARAKWMKESAARSREILEAPTTVEATNEALLAHKRASDASRA